MIRKRNVYRKPTTYWRNIKCWLSPHLFHRKWQPIIIAFVRRSRLSWPSLLSKLCFQAFKFSVARWLVDLLTNQEWTLDENDFHVPLNTHNIYCYCWLVTRDQQMTGCCRNTEIKRVKSQTNAQNIYMSTNYINFLLKIVSSAFNDDIFII